LQHPTVVASTVRDGQPAIEVTGLTGKRQRQQVTLYLNEQASYRPVEFDLTATSGSGPISGTFVFSDFGRRFNARSPRHWTDWARIAAEAA
jgi:hypothetical protein